MCVTRTYCDFVDGSSPKDGSLIRRGGDLL